MQPISYWPKAEAAIGAREELLRATEMFFQLVLWLLCGDVQIMHTRLRSVSISLGNFDMY